MKRMRGRNHRSGGGGGGGGGNSGGFRNQQNGIPLNRNHVFDSTGPEMRVRGTAQQLFDKYTQLARDAASGGDRVLGESYYQHAEHYFRIISAINQAQGLPTPPQGGQAAEEGESLAPRQDYRPDNRQEMRQETRPDHRSDNRQDNRENRNENRNENRRFEQRPRQEFQPRDRGERPFRQPHPPIAEAPIDISSALEAELAAAAAPAGFGAQPSIEHHNPEPRAIRITPQAPPLPVIDVQTEITPAAPARALSAEDQPASLAEDQAPRPRPRGRPRQVKQATEPPSE